MAPPVAPAPPVDGAAPSAGIPFRLLGRWSLRLIGWAPVLFVITLVTTVLTSLAALAQAKALEGVVGTLQGEPVSGPLAPILPSEPAGATLTFVVLGLTVLLLSFAGRIVAVVFDATLLRRLQQHLHDHILTLGPDYHRKRGQGELNALLSSYATGASVFLPDLIATPLASLVAVIAGVALLVDSLGKVGAMPMWLSGALLATLVVAPVLTIWLSGRLRRDYTIVREHNDALANEFINSTSNALEIQVLDAIGRRSDAVQGRLGALFKAKLKASMGAQVIGEFQTATVLALQVLFIGSALVVATQTEVGAGSAIAPIVGFLGLIPAVVSPLQTITAFYASIQMNWPMTEPVITTLEAVPTIRERADAQTLPMIPGPPVRLENVTFGYPDGPRVLDGVTHEFAPGKVTAIVAESGMGKSTVLHLICRLYDADAGFVSVAGSDIRSLRLASLRANVARVSQFPLLLIGTVRDNLLLGTGEQTDEELERVCRQTGLWDVLVRVTEGGDVAPLDTRLSPQEGLSGGERRLLSLTRVLARRPPVLILDEPTTGLSADWRQRLKGLLVETCRETTVLLVDHDMNFVRDLADEICVLVDGKFREKGTPEELLSNEDSGFRSLWESYNLAPDEDEIDAEASAKADMNATGPSAIDDIPMGRPPGLGA